MFKDIIKLGLLVIILIFMFNLAFPRYAIMKPISSRLERASSAVAYFLKQTIP
jgi:hypothetical protein